MDETEIRMLQLGHEGFYCSQIIVILGLELRGEENPALVRSLAGLAYGCGAGRGTCGALTGGACLLGLYAGKGASEEEESPKLMVMLQELADWFAARVGPECPGVTCELITGEKGPEDSRQECGSLVHDVYVRALELLQENGFDPYGG
ncbi:MAG: C-GCAxxG-C-C family protein [Deltaproteobacteria bacterium]|nr:C-GCAxxG-C-C family protein [Deltaproteobacteria bacterium]